MHDVAARLDGDVVIPQLSWSESRGRHAREHTHSATSTRTWVTGDTEIYANSIVHPLNGRFVNVIRIYIALAWRNKAFEHGMHTEREGKLKIKAYWNLRE